MQHDKKNIMIILSSPSGVGKTTLTKKIQQKFNNIKISVSHTTRLPRSNEVNGVDYHFVTKKEFEALIKENQFYEYAKIYENYYGRISVLTNYRYNIIKKFTVSPTCFRPKPKVTSIVIHFKPKQNNSYNIKKIENLEKITNIFFSNKRKMINKNFKKIFSDAEAKY